ncbi:MAG: hypothetical protein OXH68_18610 [Gammaproteobacteria bacterium]|nr:hypothetical protein [Gammaproteobacteria bacterium]
MTDKRNGGLRYEDLGAKMVEEFPELEDAYRKELEWWSPDEPGPHVVYGNLLNPYIIRLLESEDSPETVQRAFDLVETLLAHEDVYVQQVAMVTVLEELQGKPEWLRLMKPHAGPLARQAVRELAQFWRGELLEW